MKPLLSICSLLLIFGAVTSAIEPKPSGPPDGVRESAWSPITPTFGFVITKDIRMATVEDKKTGEKVKRIVSPRVSGYFVVLREGTWCRIDLDPNNPAVTPLVNR